MRSWRSWNLCWPWRVQRLIGGQEMRSRAFCVKTKLKVRHWRMQREVWVLIVILWQYHYQLSSVWSHVGISEWFEWTAVPISVYYFICQTCSPSMYLVQGVVCGMLPGLKGSVPLYFRTETGSHSCIPQSAVSDQSLSFQIRKPFKRKHQDGWTCLSSQKHWLCGACNWAAKSC